MYAILVILIFVVAWILIFGSLNLLATRFNKEEVIKQPRFELYKYVEEVENFNDWKGECLKEYTKRGIDTTKFRMNYRTKQWEKVEE